MSEERPTITLKYSEIIQKQATLNIITIGSVSHGKSTLVRALTGVKTQKFQKELERNCTIFLGYANGKIFRCFETGYQCIVPSDVDSVDHPETGKPLTLVKHFSFVDAPGHESLMSTMISGTQNIDVGFLVIAANDPVVPEPQTYEHLLALSVPGAMLDRFVVLQNKLDLVTPEIAEENLAKIKEFLQGSKAGEAPMIPISAQHKDNVSILADYLIQEVPEPIKNYQEPARLTIIRSFDVNKPDTPLPTLVGGIAGGSLKTGVLRVGDWIEIRPGLVQRHPSTGEFICQPLISPVVSIHSEKTTMDVAVSGGLLGVGLQIDPALAKTNGLVGQVLGHIGTLPKIYHKLVIKYHRLNHMLKEKSPFTVGEKLQACIHSKVIMARVLATDKKGKKLSLELAQPTCFEADDRISFLRCVNGEKWSLNGYGTILETTETDIQFPAEYEEYRAKQKPVRYVIDNDLPSTNDNSYKSETSDTDTDTQPKTNKYDYNELVKNVVFRGQSAQERKANRVKIPPPQVGPFNRKSIFSNYRHCCNSLDFCPREGQHEMTVEGHKINLDQLYQDLEITSENLLQTSEHFFRFMTEELAAACSLNQEQQLIISGRFQGPQIQTVVANFAQQFVRCHNHGCAGQRTFLYKKQRLSYQYCYSCHSSCAISMKSNQDS